MSDSFGGAKSPLQPPPIGPSQTYNVDPAYYGQSLELAEKMLAKLATEAATTSSAKNNKAGGDLFFQFNDNRAGDEDRRDIEELQRGKEFEVQV
jgi:hypothetical protein